MMIFDNSKLRIKDLLWTIAVVGIVIISTFGLLILSGKSMLVTDDAFRQYLPIFKDFRTMVWSFIQHPFRVGTWSWNLGTGQDWFTAYSYYIVGDPFAYLILFFSTAHIAMGYQLIIGLKLIAAGVSFSFMVSKFGFKGGTLVAGSISYVFATFGFYAAINHSPFLTALIYLPILIVGVERIFFDGNYKLILITIPLLILNSFYWGIVLALVALIVFVVQFFIERNKITAEGINAIGFWLKSILLISLAVGIAAVFLVPVYITLHNSPRAGRGLLNTPALYGLSYYLRLLTIPVGVTGTGTPLMAYLQGFSSGAVTLGFAWLLTNIKKYKVVSVLLLLSTVALMFPCFAVVFSLGNMPTNRWMFVLFVLPILGFMSLMTATEQEKQTQKRRMAFVLLVFVILAMPSFYLQGISLSTVINITVAFIGYVVIFALAEPHAKTLRVSALVVISMILSLNIGIFSSKNSTVNVSFINRNSLTKRLDLPIDVAKVLSNKHDVHTIYDKQTSYDFFGFGILNDFLSPAHSIGTYVSTAMPSMIKFGMDNKIAGTLASYPIRHLDDRYLLAMSLGANYSIGSDTSGVSKFPGSKRLSHDGQYSLFSNPFSKREAWYAHNNQVYSLDRFKKATPAEKEIMLIHGVASNNNVKDSNEEGNLGVVKNVSLKNVNTKNLKVLRDKVIVRNYKANSVVRIPVSDDNVGVGTQQLLLEYKNLKVKPISKFMQWKETAEIQNGSLSKFDKIQSFENVLLSDDTPWKMSFTVPGYGKTAIAQNSVWAGANFVEQTEGVMNAGISTRNNKIQYIDVTFDHSGDFAFNFSVEKTNLSAANKQLKKISSTNNTAELVNKTHSSVDVKLSGENGIVITNIPFSSGWQVKNKNSGAKLIEVNDGFLGLKVTKDTKNVHLKYSTPGLKAGFIISLVSLIVLVTMLKFVFVKRGN
ncbi:YfhO family protein [Weissella cibaria]|uniref:YfhO family protein n=1 Tax=Weissella cibaria TaxID=137591 RepID=UPI0023083100|nr:YfhO family protein [Weissella cibaria]WCE25840.1 YfhO family protein [Weissella cibaria]WCE28028.1 YfhO family protein [Weissella cibaria]